MASLSRTTSRGSTTSKQRSLTGSLSDDMQDVATDMSGSPSPSNASKAPQSLASTGRVPSHSLLTTPQSGNVPSRKSRFVDIETVGGNTGRASISMPPPATKPSSIYRPSTVRRPTGTQNVMETKDARTSMDGTADGRTSGLTAGLEGVEQRTSPRSVPASEPQSPSAFSDTNLKPPSSSLNKPGDRLSFSSLYSLGPSMYNGAAGTTSAPLSAASSTAGSVKSFEQPTPTATSMYSSLGPGKAEAASPAMPATDPVSVTANSQPSHQGLRLIWSRKVALRIVLIVWR